jgi:protein tyrosine/serine phosphatase
MIAQPRVPPTVLSWSRCRNTRDLGGLTTADDGVLRTGALVRSDSPHRLDAQGLEALHAYGIVRVVDLRTADELVATPGPFAGTDVLVHRPAIRQQQASDPPLPEPLDLVELYRLFLDRDRDLLTAAVCAIADAPPGGVVVHCHAGKDRTGLVVALVLAALGVLPEQIAADYAFSDVALAQHYAEELEELDDDPPRREALRAIQHARPGTMLAVLDHLDARHGGAPAYLTAGGMSAASLARLSDRILPRTQP